MFTISNLPTSMVAWYPGSVITLCCVRDARYVSEALSSFLENVLGACACAKGVSRGLALQPAFFPPGAVGREAVVEAVAALTEAGAV